MEEIKETVILDPAPEHRDAINYPSLGERVKSSSLDGLLVIILMFTFAYLLDNFEAVPDWVRKFMLVFLLVYEPLFTTLGCTLGQYMMNLRVRQQYYPTKKLTFYQAFIRFVIKLPLGILSFVTIHTNPRRRAIHDLAAGSIMVYKEQPQLLRQETAV
jgi:uncharacterized RDD family membrane protein YckC